MPNPTPLTTYGSEYVHLVSDLNQLVQFHGMLPFPTGLHYRCVEDFVLERGRPMSTEHIIVTPGMPKQCFWNARRAAKRYGWSYCEGYARTLGLTMLHAWCLDDHNRIHEVTWQSAGDAYFGLVVLLADLHPDAPYLDDWKRGYPALKLPRLTLDD